MSDLVTADYCFEMATRHICCKEGNNWIRFDTIDEAIHYLNIEMVAAADEGQMMIHPSLFVNFQKQQQLFDLLKEAGYKVYPGLAGELYAVSWEVGTSWKDYAEKEKDNDAN